jgi:hypothetical protein
MIGYKSSFKVKCPVYVIYYQPSKFAIRKVRDISYIRDDKNNYKYWLYGSYECAGIAPKERFFRTYASAKAGLKRLLKDEYEHHSKLINDLKEVACQ